MTVSVFVVICNKRLWGFRGFYRYKADIYSCFGFLSTYRNVAHRIKSFTSTTYVSRGVHRFIIVSKKSVPVLPYLLVIIIIHNNRSCFAHQRARERKSVGASPVYELNAA